MVRNQRKRADGTRKAMLAFLNSGFGLLLVGAAVGALGLFTWQRQDWIFKRDYLRAEVMLDRRLNLIETINTELGAYIADANGVIAAICVSPVWGQRRARDFSPRARTVPQMPVKPQIDRTTLAALSPNSNRADCACSTAERTSSGRTHCMKKAGTVWITCRSIPG